MMNWNKTRVTRLKETLIENEKKLKITDEKKQLNSIGFLDLGHTFVVQQ